MPNLERAPRVGEVLRHVHILKQANSEFGRLTNKQIPSICAALRSGIPTISQVESLIANLNTSPDITPEGIGSVAASIIQRNDQYGISSKEGHMELRENLLNNPVPLIQTKLSEFKNSTREGEKNQQKYISKYIDSLLKDLSLTDMRQDEREKVFQWFETYTNDNLPASDMFPHFQKIIQKAIISEDYQFLVQKQDQLKRIFDHMNKNKMVKSLKEQKIYWGNYLTVERLKSLTFIALGDYEGAIKAAKFSDARTGVDIMHNNWINLAETYQNILRFAPYSECIQYFEPYLKHIREYFPDPPIHGVIPNPQAFQSWTAKISLQRRQLIIEARELVEMRRKKFLRNVVNNTPKLL